MSSRVLVTGASGFVGSLLCKALAERGHWVRAAVRAPGSPIAGAVEHVVTGAVNGHTDWHRALYGIDAIVHCAARVHVLNDRPENDALYAATNAHGTQKLAADAARSGVRRMLLMSTVKVNGESTVGRPFTAEDQPAPAGAYAVSKWDAEQALWRIAAGSALQAVVVRPPLVYGTGVRGNFLRLMTWVAGGWPLPFGAIDNARSLLSVWNLCDASVHLLMHPAAAGRTWMVSDGEDLSIAELIRKIAGAMHRRPRLVSVPPALLDWAAALSGRRAEFERLFGSLIVDSRPLRQELGWRAPMSVTEALERTVAAHFQSVAGVDEQ